MINEETLNKLYEEVINGNELTTKKLNSYGFNSTDLTNLIKKGILERIKRGSYSFVSSSNIFLYGIHSIEERAFNKAKVCFQKCYEIDPNHYEACYQLFYQSLRENDYESAFKYFETLYNTNLKQDIANAKLYLYLLNIITDIPQKYQNDIKYIKQTDLIPYKSDEKTENSQTIYKIISNIYRRKFAFALHTLKNYLAQKEASTLEGITLKLLLSQSVQVEKENRQYVLNLIKEKKYHEVLTHLEKINNKCGLNITESYIQTLIQDILEISSTGKLHKPQIDKTSNIFAAIDGYNYTLALQLCYNFNGRTGIDSSDNELHLLLLDICSLIKNIKNNETPTQPTKKVVLEASRRRLIQEPSAEAKKYIEEKHTLLVRRKGIVLLRPMNDQEMATTFKILREYPDVVSFRIGENSKQHIVMKYRSPKQASINVTTLIRQGNEAYKEGNYDECINCFLPLLQEEEPEAKIYAKLGLAYMKKFAIKLAVEYLTIATELSKSEGSTYNFVDLIAKLNGDIEKNDRKPSPLMHIDEFEISKDNYFGIDNIDDITAQIISLGLDVDSACVRLGFNQEQINIIKLIYAKTYYTQGEYDKGDEFFIAVEKSKNKTPNVIKLQEEIRKNRRFYINRQNNTNKRLVRTLHPKK